jgi:hypothetical protein
VSLCYNIIVISAFKEYIMIIYTNVKSKRKSKTKKEIAQYQDWLARVRSDSSGLSSKYNTSPSRATKTSVGPSPSLSYKQHTKSPKLPSVVSSHFDTFKKPVLQYTGDKMIGIGTLHKSNAIPLFRLEDVKDQAKMRR